MNQYQLCEIERTLGFTYPPSFHSAVDKFTVLCGRPGFKHAFGSAKLLLSVSEIISERKSLGDRARRGVSGISLLPAESVGDISYSTVVPFLRDQDSEAPDIFTDTYAFDLESQGPEYSVIVVTYSDLMIVNSWDGFLAFFQWMSEFVASKETS